MAAQIIPDTLKKAQQVMMGASGNKNAQLLESMVTPDEKSRITTDYGVKQANTDEWLRVTSDNQTGPMLLEDPFAREKVSIQINAATNPAHQRRTSDCTSF
jgi:catalase